MTSTKELHRRLMNEAVDRYRRTTKYEAMAKLSEMELEQYVQSLDVETLERYVELTREIDEAYDRWLDDLNERRYKTSTMRSRLSAEINRAGMDIA